jgi:hypothetical protein
MGGVLVEEKKSSLRVQYERVVASFDGFRFFIFKTFTLNLLQSKHLLGFVMYSKYDG